MDAAAATFEGIRQDGFSVPRSRDIDIQSQDCGMRAAFGARHKRELLVRNAMGDVVKWITLPVMGPASTVNGPVKISFARTPRENSISEP